MRPWKLFRTVAALMLALVLAPALASAQEADTLCISGTFHINALLGTVGTDLAQVYANGNDNNGWVLTLHGVTYSHDTYYWEWDSGYDQGFITYVNATSFDFQFVGPDANVLNEVVAGQLSLSTDAPFLMLKNRFYYDSIDTWSIGWYSDWSVTLSPDVPQGVAFYTGFWSYWIVFNTDEYGYPVVEPQRVLADVSRIDDMRPGNAGGLESYYDLVDLGSSVPPVVPPPPPSLSIADGSVAAGKKAAKLTLTVTLSRSSTDAVTVHYATSNGTAIAGQDYIAASGDLTIPSGQTSRTITLTIKANGKRTSNKTFSVTLSNAAGATIENAVATVTILK